MVYFIFTNVKLLIVCQILGFFCIDLKLFYESFCSSLNKKAAKTTVFMETNNDFVVRVTFGVIFEVDILCVILVIVYFNLFIYYLF